ncbi:metallohydrolase [Thiocapsa rosea]|nr:metallohydrolase [Thiocapsa rosea]
MTLLELDSGRKILIDINIREAADDPEDETPDAARMLRERLNKDPKTGNYYVDAFLLSHPDQDHCRGLERHFHLGPPEEHAGDDKIIIREMWSSPMVFRRASRRHTLCADAKAWNSEAKRRVQYFRDDKPVNSGNRILILGADENGKTDDLTPILITLDQEFRSVDGVRDSSFSARLLAPMSKSDDEAEEELLTKNNSSVVLRFKLSAEGNADACRYLTGGDAEVAIWERLWTRHKNRPDWLDYDLLLTPHHCSWHSLSYDSWSDLGDDAEVSPDARNALSQARGGAYLVSSSKEILDDNNDPPCIRAKREYEAIAKEASGLFKRVTGPKPSKYIISSDGPRFETQLSSRVAVTGGGAVGGQALPHG